LRIQDSNESLQYLPVTLINLNVSYCKRLTDNAIQYLNHATSLHYLSLAQCFIGDNGVKKVLSNVKHLNINFCNKITFKGLKSLSKRLKLTNLEMRDVPINTLEMLESFTTLKYLNIGNCYKVYDRTLKSLPKSLTHLSMSSCSHITEEGLKILPPSLESLDLSHVLGITSLEGIVKLVSLSVLNVSWTKVTNSSLKHFPQSLTRLIMYDCPQITSDTVSQLTTMMPGLQVIM